MATYKIYKITNTITGKCYIGQTTQRLKARWAYHNSSASGCLAIKSSIKKYSKEKHNIELIQECVNKQQADDLECKFINDFNTLVPNGYNICLGGGAPMTGRKHSEEAKYKISLRMKELGHKPIITAEGIKKAIEVNKLRVGKLHPNAREILCLTNNIKYDTIREACKQLNLQPGNVHKVLCGLRKHTGKFVFKYTSTKFEKLTLSNEQKEQININLKTQKLKEPTINKRKFRTFSNHAREQAKLSNSGENSWIYKKGYLHKKCQRVLCVTTGQEFYSQKEAARQLNVHQGSLQRVLKGRASHTKGYVFTYVKDEKCPVQ